MQVQCKVRFVCLASSGGTENPLRLFGLVIYCLTISRRDGHAVLSCVFRHAQLAIPPHLELWRLILLTQLRLREMEWRLKACDRVGGFTKPAALFTNHDMEPEINTFYTEIYVRPSPFVSHPDWRVTVFFCAALLLLAYWRGWWLDHGSKLSVLVLVESSWGVIHLLSLVYESETWVKVVIVQGCRT